MNAKLTISQLQAAGFSPQQIKMLTDAGQVKKEAPGKTPVASVINYTNQKGETNTFLRLSLNGQEWGCSMVRINAGPVLTEEGKSKVVQFANALGDLLNTDMPILPHGKKV